MWLTEQGPGGASQALSLGVVQDDPSPGHSLTLVPSLVVWNLLPAAPATGFWNFCSLKSPPPDSVLAQWIDSGSVSLPWTLTWVNRTQTCLDSLHRFNWKVPWEVNDRAPLWWNVVFLHPLSEIGATTERIWAGSLGKYTQTVTSEYQDPWKPCGGQATVGKPCVATRKGACGETLPWIGEIG